MSYLLRRQINIFGSTLVTGTWRQRDRTNIGGTLVFYQQRHGHEGCRYRFSYYRHFKVTNYTTHLSHFAKPATICALTD